MIMLGFLLLLIILRISGNEVNVSMHNVNYLVPQIVSCVESVCLPSFVIAGTQKSGTTFLSSLLYHHPDIRFARTKEAHFFDKTARYSKGIEEYLSHFPSWQNRTTPPLYGESTPYYIASRVCCKRIAQTIPNVKMIVLLRDPVARAFSEYQMKVRRVIDQAGFFKLLTFHESAVYSCLSLSDATDIFNCVPNEIREHSRWNKLKKALTKAFDELGDWNEVQRLCFQEDFVYPPKPVVGKYTRSLKYDKTSSKVYLNTSYNVNTRKTSDNYEYEPLLNNLTIHNEITTPKFNHKACWNYSKTSYESVKSIKEAFVDEIEEFTQCAGELLHFHDTDDNMILSQLDKSIEQCLKVRSGISQQYFYRSLYVIQLYHCFKYINPSQFLILHNEDLRSNPNKTLNQVLEFIGVSSMNITITNDSDAETYVQQSFPKFERVNGWKLNGQYESTMDEETHTYLQTFFAPYNDLLTKFLRDYDLT